MVKKLKFRKLFTWRSGGKAMSAERLADMLSVENTPHDTVPAELRDDLKKFRGLTQERRITQARMFTATPAKPPSPVRLQPNTKTDLKGDYIAVCGYISETFKSQNDAKEWLTEKLSRGTFPRGFIIRGQVTVVQKNFRHN